jgi:hypothetical protein
MKYNNFRQRDISISEANKILKLLKDVGVKIIYVSDREDLELAKASIPEFNYSTYAIIKETKSHLWIETKYYEPKYKATRYICELNGELETRIKGQQAFASFQRCCLKVPHVREYGLEMVEKYFDEDLGKYTCSASPIVDYNKKYEDMKVEFKNVYEYDLNSAYSSIMLKSIPDLNNPIINAKLKEGQVGFYIDKDLKPITKVGAIVDVAFNLIELPKKSKDFILKLYNEKETAKTKTERAAAKQKLNFAIGYYQRYNPFLRAWIVHSCNKFVESLIDDDTIFWNTDAIFSLKRRPELTVGTSIGEFEEIYIKRLAMHNNNYQVNYELPKIRNIPKAWYKDGFDLMKDELPNRDNNRYKFDLDQLKIKENYNG